jgi:long-subunit fatty acid transport protein
MHKYILIISLTASPAFAQQGGEITGESPLTAGTAGASIGSGQSILDSSSNPSTLIHVFENSRFGRFDQRYEGMLRAVGYNTSITTSLGEELAIDLPMGIGPWMGYAERISKGRESMDMVWGINIQPTVAGDFSTSRNTYLNLVREDPLDETTPYQQSRVDISSKLLQLALEPNISVRVNDSWSFGVGASIRNTDMLMSSATEVGFEKLQGDFVLGGGTWGDFFQGAGGDNFQATFDADASSSTPTVFFKLGATYSTQHGSNIGFWLRPPSTSSDIEGRVDVDMRDDLGTFISVLGGEPFNIDIGLENELVSGYDFSIADVRFPAQAGVSYSSPATDTTRWHSKAVFTQWSKSMTGWTAHLSNPDNSEFTDFIGGDGSMDIDMGIQWKDSLSVSVGFEHDMSFNITNRGDGYRKVNDYTLRGGLGWSSNPVSGAAMPGLTPFNRWQVALGMSSWANDRDLLDMHMAVVVTLPDTWTAGENALLSDLSYDEYSQFAYSFMLGCSYSF